MIRGHFTAGAPGLIGSDVNFNFSGLLTTVDFVFHKSGVLLILHHGDTVSN